MKQEAPFAVQIEPTEGCTLACHFCAIQSIRDNGADAEAGKHGKHSPPYKFMSLDTVHRIGSELKRLDWNARIEFAMHGEPTVHPQLPLIVQTMRHYRPKASIMVTSNGSGVMSLDRIKALFDAGLNTLALDDYKHANFVDKVIPHLQTLLIEGGIYTFHYPAQKHASPHTRFTGKRIVIIEDITMNVDGTHKLTNQGGNSFAAVEPLERRCAKPFRELSIRWDGNVALCCDDWRGEYKIANINTLPLDDLWNHPRFEAARKALYHKRRDLINVCSGCSVTTYRDGLLPDKYGKKRISGPSTHDLAQITAAQRGKVFTPKLKAK